MKWLMNLQLRLLSALFALLGISGLFWLDAATRDVWAAIIHAVPVFIMMDVAALVMTLATWPEEGLEVMRHLYNKVLELHPPQLDVKDFLFEVRKLLPRVATNGRETEYVAMQFDELLDVSNTIINGPFRSPVGELSHRFYWDNIEIGPTEDFAVPSTEEVVGMKENLDEEMIWAEETLDGRLQMVPVIIAETVK